MEAAGSFKMLANFYQTIQYHVSELKIHCDRAWPTGLLELVIEMLLEGGRNCPTNPLDKAG